MRKKVTKKARTITKQKELPLTAANLQGAAWTTLQLIQRDEIKPIVANAIAKQVREICNVEKLKLEFTKLSGHKPRKNQFLLV